MVCMLHTHVMWAIVALVAGVIHNLPALLPSKWAVSQRPAALEKSALGSARYFLVGGHGFFLDSGPLESVLSGLCRAKLRPFAVFAMLALIFHFARG